MQAHGLPLGGHLSSMPVGPHHLAALAAEAGAAGVMGRISGNSLHHSIKEEKGRRDNNF